MNYLIYLGHPAHFHLFRGIHSRLQEKGHKGLILIRSKDVLQQLCTNSGLEYENVLPEQRSSSYFSLGVSYLRKYFRISRWILRFKPQILLGSEPTLTHLGKVFDIPSIVFSEDDARIIPQFAKIAYPFVDVILSPDACDAGRWDKKKVGYRGFHKLAYLHPRVFKPERVQVGAAKDQSYFLLRFAALSAYHDKDKTGISAEVARRLITLLLPFGKVLITSERPLEPEFEKYRLRADPLQIHNIMFYAQMYIGDSQSMAVEAALLGTPGIRFNDFAGEIGVLNELEHKYQLTSSFKTRDTEAFFEKVSEMLMNRNLRAHYSARKSELLKDKIDVREFFVWFIENYPESYRIMKTNPDYQSNFM